MELYHLGCSASAVELDDIFRQQRASLVGRGVEAVKAHVLAPHVRAQSHRIALGGGEIDERMVFEGVGDRREHAGLLAPDLDGPRDMVAVLEAEAHDDMRHLGASPIGEEQVECFELGEVVGALVPTLGEVLVGAPVEIPHVGQRQNVAFYCSRRLTRNIGRPVAVERRRDRAPPGEQAAECDGENSKRDEAAAQAHEQRHDRHESQDAEDDRGGRPQDLRRRKPEP